MDGLSAEMMQNERKQKNMWIYGFHVREQQPCEM